MYKQILKPLLFLLPPEQAHSFSLKALNVVLKIPILNSLFRYSSKPTSSVTVDGITYANRIGLAAGFDKNASYFQLMSQLGFGCIEIGTVTPMAQSGNATPRLFRLPKDEALINRMGFNNDGVEQAIHSLKNRKKDLIIGGNIGRNKTTSNANAIDDYSHCFNALFDYVDYFAVNVSSPNTPNLRELQEKNNLYELLNHLQLLNQEQSKTKPIYLKIALDLTKEQLNDVVDVVKKTKIQGIICCNTSISRDGLTSSEDKIVLIGQGGLSGKPLFERSLDIVKFMRGALGEQYTIIGVGGINSAERAQAMITAGADLIQIYTALIYEGPALIKRIDGAL